MKVMGGRTVDALLRAMAEERAGQDAVRCDGDWLTFGDLDAAAERVASGLAARHAAKGERVAIISTNRQEMVELLFGGARRGVVQVPLNPYLKGEFLRYQLSDSGARVLVTDAAGWRNAEPILAGTEIQMVVLLDDVDAGAAPRVEVLSYQELCSVGRPGQAHEAVEAGDLVSILYTSGTTGMPKGCMLSNGYYTHVPTIWQNAGWILPDDRWFSAAPLFHAAGQLFQLIPCVAIGCSAHFEASFHASTYMQQAKEAEATLIGGAGSMAAAILAQPPSPADAGYSFRLASWNALDPDRQVEFERRFGTPVCCENYGQTECATAAIIPLAEAGHRRTMGKAAPAYEIRVVDDDDREVPAGETGEMVIRPREPETMFQGYWRKPEETLATFRNLWHHTGDYVVMDPQGRLTFIDRKKDALRRRGENVSAIEVEAAILRCPGVADVAVCAVPSIMGEDEIKACIVAQGGTPPGPAALFEFFRDNLPYYAIPRYVQFRTGLPLTPTGKIMKHVLREEGVSGDIIDLDALGLTVPKQDRRTKTPKDYRG